MTEPMTWTQRNTGSLSRRFIPLGLIGLLALSACAPEEGTEDAPEETEAVSDTEPVEDEEVDEDSAAGDEDAPAEDEAENNYSAPTDTSDISHEDALDTVSYEFTSPEADGEIEIGLHGLDVGEEGMLLTVSFVPEYDDSAGPQEFRAMHETYGQYLLPMVSDRDNFKAYYVPKASEERTGGMSSEPEAGWVGNLAGEAWASEIGENLVASDQTLVLWAYFPIPEDDIDTVDVAVVPGAPEFKDVEINWGDQQPVTSDSEDSETDDDDEDSDEPVEIEADEEEDADE